MMINKLVFAGLLACCCAVQSFGQLVNTQFGQNRVQYESYDWYRYESPHFAVSFPAELEDMAQYVTETAESDYLQLKSVLEYDIRNKIEIIVYGDYSDYLQNNIGLYTQTVNNGGSNRLFSYKILAYFDGSHRNLRLQIREGISRALLSRMIYGGNLQEIVQNAVLLQLPLWFTEGMVAYAVAEWDEAQDDALREAFLSGRYGHFLDLAREKPTLAGQSMMHYIAQRYGTSAVSNLLYLSRTYRNAESGFTYVFGTSFYSVANNWFEFYQNRYNGDNENRKIPTKGELKLATKSEHVYQPRLSPDGKWVAYVSQHKGRQILWLHEVATNKARKVWEAGLVDLADKFVPDYPRLAWSKNGQLLYFSQQLKNTLQINQYNLADKRSSRKIQLKDLEAIQSMDAVSNQDVAVTATSEGQSDLYLINLQTGKTQQLTNDAWDDKELAYAKLNGSNGLLFTSTRDRVSLGKIGGRQINNNKPNDLYFYNLDTKGELLRLSNTPYFDEQNPTAVSEQQYAFLSNANGIINRHVGRVDTVLDYYNTVFILKDKSSRKVKEGQTLADLDTAQIDSQYREAVFIQIGKNQPNTDYSRSIAAQHVSNSKIADLIFYKDSMRVFVRDLSTERSENPANTWYRKYLNDFYNLKIQAAAIDSAKALNGSAADELKRVEEEMKANGDSLKPNGNNAPSDTGKIDIDNYLFQSEFDDIKKPPVPKPDSSEPNQKPQPTVLIEGENGDINQQQPKEKPVTNPNADTVVTKYRFDPSQKTKYRGLFRADGFALQADNTPLFGGLDLFLQNSYRFTPLSLMSKVNFSDIFENYRVEIGLRIPLTFNGFDTYFVFDDRKGKLDKRYAFYRRSRIDDFLLEDTSTNQTAEAKGRNVKYLAQFELKYPLDKYRSIRGIFSIQSDRIAILADEINTLAVPIFIKTKAWLRGEYVYDNTVDMSMNIRKGSRYKFYLDIFKPFEIVSDPKLGFDFSGGLSANVGLDYRRYFSIDNKSIFAVRAAWASSIGYEKILYSLGGVENGIFSGTNNTIPLPNFGNYGYQTLAAPLRGFDNNIRNGSSFAVINTELRIPVIQYLSKSVRSNFLRTLQIVPFFDIGTAWHGLSPFSEDNPLNVSLIDNGTGSAVSPIRVRVQYYRQPIVAGFGCGIRTVVSGHFVRFDLATGLETGLLQTPKLHFAIGTDF